MKIVLTQDVKKIGKRGSVIEVADGYGTFLIQKGFGKAGTHSAVAQAKNVAIAKAAIENKEVDIMMTAYKALENVSVVIPVRVNEKGVMYAQVHATDISESIKLKFGVVLPPALIALPEALKHTGMYILDLKSGKIKKQIEITLIAQGLAR